MNPILFKSAFRNLQNRKWYTILSLLGLSVGFSAFIIIGLFIKYELDWDTFNENYANIYRIQTYKTVGDEHVMQSAPAIYQDIKNKYSDIENQALVFSNQIKYLSVKEEQDPVEAEGQYSDQGFLDIFSYNFVAGTKSTALSEPLSIVLSETLAETLFGTENPVGSNMLLDKKHPLKVTGVFEDQPKNAHLQPEFIISVQSLIPLWNMPAVLDSWDYTVFYTYILTKEGADIDLLNASLKDLLKDKVLTDYRQLYLKHLSKLYMYSTNNNYMIVIYMLGIFSVLVLLLAAINYMNLIIATSTLRAKEIGIKKVIGSNRRQLMMQIFLESFIISILSLIFSLIIVELALNIFNEVTNKDISIRLLVDNNFYILIVSILLFTSGLSSIYPSLLITSIKSIELFKQNVFIGKRNRISLKKYLVGFQYAVSIGLITMAVLLSKQVWFMHSKDLGFNKEDLVFAEMNSGYSDVSLKKMKDLLEMKPEIKLVSFSLGLPMNSSRYTAAPMMNWEGNAREEFIEVVSFWVSYDYVKTMEIEIVKGRNFSRDYPTDVVQGCLINETAAKAFGWENPIGKYINDRQLQVVGVFRDIHFHDIYNKIKPLVLTVIDDERIIEGMTYFNLKIENGTTNEVKLIVHQTLKEYFPKNPYEVMAFEDHFKEDQHFAIFDTIIHIFIFLSIIAILLSIFGVIGLVHHSLNQRTKEIAIRKVSGCSSWSIFNSLTGEYMLIILIAATFGSFGARYVFNDFPLNYPMPQRISDYLIGIAIALFITLISIFYKTIKESRRNPVDALRYE